jgi:peptidoglycan/LPS O-acetylase OafA/YrhL
MSTGGFLPNTLQAEPSTANLSRKHTSVGSVHLDALRGGAALLVFLNHTRALYYTSALQQYDVKNASASGQSITLQSSETVAAHPKDAGANQAFSDEIKLASEAVIIFFVLSGYLVGGSVLKLMRTSMWSWRVYLTKRLSRLYVVLLPALLVGACLDHLGLHLFGLHSVYHTPPGIQIVTTYHLAERLRPLVALGNIAFLQTIVVPEFGSNVSVWSLANEFWYYIIFPLLVLAWNNGRQAWFRMGCCLIALGLLWFVGIRIALLFPVWTMGALLVLLPRKLKERQARAGAILAFSVLVLCMLGMRLLHARAIVADYVIAMATCAFLFFAVQQRSQAKESSYKVIAGFFSRISYSLYLFHLPLALFLCGLVNNPWHPWHMPQHLGTFVVVELTVLICVYALWRLFEANTDAMRAWIFREQKERVPVVV